MWVAESSPMAPLDAAGSPTSASRGAVPAGPLPLGNSDIADRFEEVARLLEGRRANPFRVDAYRRAAETLRELPRGVAALAREEGREGLEALPGIGHALSHAMLELLETGRLSLLDRLIGEAHPETLFASLPGIGPELARRIHERLGIETLEDLELAAWNGRLDAVPGFGPRRVETLRSVLDQRLGRRWGGRLGGAATPSPGGAPGVRPEPPEAGTDAQGEAVREPSIRDLLSVDAEYRLKAEAGALRLVAPRRFNPNGVAWLPVLHTERGGRSFRALFSNTLDAHRLGRTHDWVVVYQEDGSRGPATVVTERRGELAGQRVVRGREEECRRHYLANRAT